MRNQDMEHLRKRWKIDNDSIVTTEKNSWWIADAQFDLPGDESGRKTMRHICALHNRWLADQKSSGKERK